MKKIAFICIALLLILSGCKGSAQAPVATEAPTQDTSVEIEVPVVISSPTPQETAWPYPSDEDTFVPEVTEPPTPEPTLAPTFTPEPTDTPQPEERYVAPEGVETVAWMSDTQHYANYAAKDLPDIYPVMTGFLRDQAEKMHLVYIVHTGDLVHVNNSEENWRVARMFIVLTFVMR